MTSALSQLCCDFSFTVILALSQPYVGFISVTAAVTGSLVLHERISLVAEEWKRVRGGMQVAL